MKFEIVQEIVFEAEADSRFEALEWVGEHMQELLDNRRYRIEGAFYCLPISRECRERDASPKDKIELERRLGN